VVSRTPSFSPSFIFLPSLHLSIYPSIHHSFAPFPSLAHSPLSLSLSLACASSGCIAHALSLLCASVSLCTAAARVPRLLVRELESRCSGADGHRHVRPASPVADASPGDLPQLPLHGQSAPYGRTLRQRHPGVAAVGRAGACVRAGHAVVSCTAAVSLCCALPSCLRRRRHVVAALSCLRVPPLSSEWYACVCGVLGCTCSARLWREPLEPNHTRQGEHRRCTHTRVGVRSKRLCSGESRRLHHHHRYASPLSLSLAHTRTGTHALLFDRSRFRPPTPCTHRGSVFSLTLTSWRVFTCAELTAVVAEQAAAHVCCRVDGGVKRLLRQHRETSAVVTNRRQLRCAHIPQYPLSSSFQLM
jgi:hypothetical protein